MIKLIGQFLVGLGPLRWLLGGAAVINILFRPAPGTEVVYEGIAFFPTLLFPVMAPILFMLLMLDAMMTRVLLSDKDTDNQIRMRRAVWTDLFLGISIAIVWYPYFSHLLGG